jgi:hypothetical protein
LSSKLDQQYPHGTFVQRFWLPVIRAESELKQGRGSKALSLLSASEPLDPAVADGFSISPLFPSYVLGHSYLAAGDGNKAGDEFQKLLEHRGMVLNSPLAALAQLGLARAHAMAGRSTEALAAYDRFLTAWKDADPGLPILRQARAKADRLRPGH